MKKQIRELIRKAILDYKPQAIRELRSQSQMERKDLGITTIRDRIIQQCFKPQVLEPICEAKFHPQLTDLGDRKRKSCDMQGCQSLINNAKLH